MMTQYTMAGLPQQYKAMTVGPGQVHYTYTTTSQHTHRNVSNNKL